MTTYIEMLGNLPVENDYTDQEYFDMILGINTEKFESNEWIEETMAAIKDGWVPYVMSKEGIELASIENPVDMSELLMNNSFDNSWSGWTYTVSRGNPGIEGKSDNCAEFWSTGTFDIYQEVPMLSDGYWRLEVERHRQRDLSSQRQCTS